MVRALLNQVWVRSPEPGRLDGANRTAATRYVFAVRRRDGSLGCARPASVTRLLRLLGLVDEQQRPVVMHGFRATFRVWPMAAEAFFGVCEAAFAHIQSDQTVSAYPRSDLFERPRVLMQRWADYVVPGGWS